MVSKIQSTSTHILHSNEALPQSPIQTAEPYAERGFSQNSMNNPQIVTTQPDQYLTATINQQPGVNIAGVAMVQQEYGVDGGKHYLTLMDVNNETLQAGSNRQQN